MRRGTWSELEGEGHSLHDLGCISHVDFSETIPNDMTVFIFPNLDLPTATGRVFIGKQVKEVFVVNLYEGTLETKVPSTSSFLAELPCTRKDCCNSPWDDTHTILGISRIGVEVDTGHRMRLSGTGLSVCEDGTVEALQESRNQRICGRGKDSMLSGRGTVDLIKSELLFL